MSRCERNPLPSGMGRFNIRLAALEQRLDALEHNLWGSPASASLESEPSLDSEVNIDPEPELVEERVC